MITAGRPDDLTLANWDLGGSVSAWSYRHADQLFWTQPLTPGLPSIEDDHGPRTAIPDTLGDQLSSGLVSAITIRAGGRTVFRWPDEPTGRHLLMSVSKIFASVAIGLLADRGDLEYDRSVRDYLPELGVQWQPCQVRHVLDMTSGVECAEVGDPGAYLDPDHPFYRFEASLGWRPAVVATSPYDLVRSYRRSGVPGTRYAYTSVNTFLLAWMIERVTGLDYPRALQTLIWEELALGQDAAICVSSSGTAVAHGGLMMTVDDLARFGTLFIPSTPQPAHSLIIPDSYLTMLREPRNELVADTVRWPEGAHPAGQWNLIHADGDLFKSGFGGQGLYVSPANEVVIAFTGIPDSQGHTNRLASSCRSVAQAIGRQDDSF
ncbi:MAG TPA: serine hydrolase domain-containing protein [Microlunatus sp.]